MVGLASVGTGGWARKLIRSISHDKTESIDHTHHKPARRHVPLFASPLDPKATQWLDKKHSSGNLTLRRRPTIAQFEAERFAGGIFRKQHEATTLELFFDLFFVANLAVFTANFQHTSASSLGNYVGFFTIIWFTWFHISIFDVRFYVDSLFNRLCKLVSFGVFVAFTGLGPIYDTIMYDGTSRAFHGLALVLMLSRLVLLLQHATVLWFVRDFKKTVLPLALMIAIYLASAMGFLATYLDDRGVSSIDKKNGLRHVIIWYAIIGVEAFLVIIVSSVWRILSFKHTHLVERIGLLTLIIMGEGIIGLTKAVAYMLSGTNISVWSIFGKVVAAVMLIYEIYLLYFSPIEHDRFGTIRQQFWTLLHFPLHVGILLTEEASAVSILWDAVMDARTWWKSQVPSLNNPSQGYTSTDALVKKINATMLEAQERYHYTKLKDFYKWDNELYRLKNINASYGSEAWTQQASTIMQQMYVNTTNFFFDNFNFEESKKAKYISDPNKKEQMSFDAYKSVFIFFYAAAGTLLCVMALMYWAGKRNKSKEEWAAIMIRLVVGLALPVTIIAAFINPGEDGFMFTESGWVIPIVTFALLLVVLLDNHINSWVDKKLDAYEEDVEDGTRTEKTHGDHRYGALHGEHVDAQAAAMHFGKPSHQAHGDAHGSHDWTHAQSQSQAHSRVPSRRPSVNFDDHRAQPRGIAADEDEERTPFVAAGPFPSSEHQHTSSDSPQLPMPTPLSTISTSYMGVDHNDQMFDPTNAPTGSMQPGQGWQNKLHGHGEA